MSVKRKIMKVEHLVGMASRPVLACLLGLVLGFTPRSVFAVLADTEGIARPWLEITQPMGLGASGVVCTHVQAGATVNPNRGGFAACNLSVRGLAGLGRTRPKFPQNMPSMDSMYNWAIATRGRASTLSSAEARWQSFIGPPGPPGGRQLGLATHRASANVSAVSGGLFNPAPPGRGVGESRDPIELVFDVSDLLSYSLILGDAGASASELGIGFFADDPLVTNSLEYSASFQNVSYNGQPLNGELFSLVISSEGVITSREDLDVQFTPWSGSGLTSSQVDDVESLVKDSLTLLVTGFVGLTPGTELVLFGTGGLLPAVVFEHQATTVLYEDRLVAQTSVVPVPGSIGFVVLGIGWIGRRVHSKTYR